MIDANLIPLIVSALAIVLVVVNIISSRSKVKDSAEQTDINTRAFVDKIAAQTFKQQDDLGELRVGKVQDAGQIAALTLQISGLTNTVNVGNTQITSLKATITDNNTQLTDLKAEVIKGAADVAALKVINVANGEEILTLKKLNETTLTALDIANAQLVVLNKQVTRLSNELLKSQQDGVDTPQSSAQHENDKKNDADAAAPVEEKKDEPTAS